MMKTIMLSAVFIGCFGMTDAQEWTITAQLTGFTDGAKFYLMDPDTNSNVDSATLKNGRLTMRGHQPSPPSTYWLTSTIDKKFYYAVLLFGNEAISIKGDKDQFPFELKITGSKIQDDFGLLMSQGADHYKYRKRAIEQMMSFDGPDADHKRDSIWALVRVQDSLDGIKTRKFIEEHTDTYAALGTLFYQRENYSHDSLRKLLDRVSAPVRNSKFGKRLENYLSIGTPLKTGDQLYDFRAFDSSGVAHQLSKFKGRYILLDFTSTYCGPCVESVPELKAEAIKYADQLNVVSVSGDISKEIWLKGLLRDRPTWLSLWDGKGSYGETMMKYGVGGFPTFCLINPDGKIIIVAVGYGKDDKGKGSIETMLSKYIGKK